MPMTSSRALSFLHEDLVAMLRRRTVELIGTGVVVFCLALLVALATWSVKDPSLSHAVDLRPKNWLGYPGAIASDFLMQLFGIASIAAVLPVGIFGWQIITHRPIYRVRIRVAAWLVGLALSAGAAACLPATAGWPLPAGLGGVLGDAMMRVPYFLFGTWFSAEISIVFGVTFLVFAAIALALACGFGLSVPEEDEEDEYEDDEQPRRRFFSVGAIFHGILAIKARLAGHGAPLRVTLREMFGRDEDEIPLVPRREPNLNGAAAAADLEEEEYEDEGEEEEEERVVARRKPQKRRGRWEFPPLELLGAAPKAAAPMVSQAALDENARRLEGVLKDFGVQGEIVNVRPGPVVTLYELEPAPGIKSSRVIGLADDIARSMSAVSARVAVVPGRNAIGIELPNPRREKVVLREMLSQPTFERSEAHLPICLGKTIGGEPVIVDLARMPHLLIAGTTGSGKSVAINTMILSLLYHHRPEECRLILIDPKMLELSVYDGIPHLLSPVVTDPRKAIIALKWAVREMEERYKRMSKLGVRNIDGFNARVAEARQKGEVITRTVQTGFDRETGEAIYEKQEMDLDPLPFIVVVVDEMADLMMVAGKDIEGAIQRLAQMARAAGIHVILATQRPSVDVITGTIKANFPTRISFQVTSKIDSRTILGEQGAEQLLGQGDMLYMAGGGRISRVHGPFVADREVERVVDHLKEQGTPEYLEAVTAEPDEEGEDGGSVFDKGAFGEGEGGDLYQKAVQIVLRDRKASTSYVQRRLQIGYNRAASIIERMEKEGVVGPANHAGKREILVEGREEAY
ncbi:MAG TPA: DNA translocase FtsK 4TM domain-containing protein [Xanthobacteraceae bacterium]|nr:DNA translocase FtsK 4TM domain-containing protein [Xanthobacteraceae bacterium]